MRKSAWHFTLVTYVSRACQAGLTSTLAQQLSLHSRAQVFERRLTDNIRALDFHKILDPANVRRIVEEADGYQPHLIAPEMGYRRLLQECLVLFKGPAETAVDEVRRCTFPPLVQGDVRLCIFMSMSR